MPSRAVDILADDLEARVRAHASPQRAISEVQVGNAVDATASAVSTALAL